MEQLVPFYSNPKNVFVNQHITNIYYMVICRWFTITFSYSRDKSFTGILHSVKRCLENSNEANRLGALILFLL